MSEKKTFVTLEQLKEIDKTYPTPYHLYDEKGIRDNAKRLKEAFAWNKGYREYFAVKATPNPYILNILKEYGCGVDCASETELMMAYALDYKPGEIMFSSMIHQQKNMLMPMRLVQQLILMILHTLNS